MRNNLGLNHNNLASRRLRWVAFAIDGIALKCIFLAFPKLIAGLTLERLVYSGAYPIMFLAYATIMEYKFQATLGKILCKIKIEATDGTNPKLIQAFMRNASKLIPFEMVSAFFGRDRVLHDIISKTRVVKLNY